MKRKRRIFPQEFKIEAVKLVIEGNYSVPEAAASLSIGQSKLSKWILKLTHADSPADAYFWAKVI